MAPKHIDYEWDLRQAEAHRAPRIPGANDMMLLRKPPMTSSPARLLTAAEIIGGRAIRHAAATSPPFLPQTRQKDDFPDTTRTPEMHSAPEFFLIRPFIFGYQK